MILPIYTYGQPVLRKICEDITADYPDLPALITNMIETMNNSDGVGLAAPQIGLSIRLLVIGLDGLKEEFPEYEGMVKAYINAHIVEEERDTAVIEEGCLSIPGIQEGVRRPKRVRIQYVDENFVAHDEWFEGFHARVLQHEIDHLDGKLFIDYLSPLRKQMVNKKLNALLKGNFSCRYKVKPARR